MNNKYTIIFKMLNFIENGKCCSLTFFNVFMKNRGVKPKKP